MSNYNTQLQANNSSLEEIITQLNELPDVGGTDPILQDKTVTPSTSQQTVTADSGYDGLDTVTVNAMPTATQATPSITVNSSGLITATATQTAGYVAAGTKSATKQLAFQAAQTIIPGTTNQTIASGQYLTGVQTIKGDANLVASNIVSGKSIFGVVGTANSGGGSSGGDTSAEDGLVTRTLTTYTNDRVTTIGNYAFYSCSSLTSVSFPQCTTIGDYAFRYCSSLTTVNFPAVTTIGASAFVGCLKLAGVSFPAVTAINLAAFQNCSNLTTVSFPKITNISSYAFLRCSKLASIYLAASTVCFLEGSDAFSQTSIWSNKGSIFVPASLLASYKAATNWVFFSNRIFSYNFT